MSWVGLFRQNKRQEFRYEIREKLRQEKDFVLKCICGHYKSQHYYDISRRKHEEFQIKWGECPLCPCSKFKKEENTL